MAGALVRAPAAGRAVWSAAGRAAAWGAGYALVDGGLARLQEWLERQDWSGRRIHRGLDVPAPVGTPVLAPTEAVVIGTDQTDDAGTSLYLAGPRAARTNASDPARWPRPAAWFAPGTPEAGRDELGVDDSGWRFGFAHLSGVNVEPREIVRRGQQVATTGNSGRSTVPHLHVTTFWVQDGVRDIHTFVDPALLIPGLRPSVPSTPIGPGAVATICVLVRTTTQASALARCVVQRAPAGGLALNWAATMEAVQ